LTTGGRRFRKYGSISKSSKPSSKKSKSENQTRPAWSAGFLLFAFCFAFAGCKPAAPTEWQYDSFTTRELEHDAKYHVTEHYSIKFLHELGDKGEWGMASTEYQDIGILNRLGQRGWELAWTDGRKFIMKRQSRIEGTFLITIERGE
jgi:hypothetical protein